jgi:hypothetical protein
MKIIRNTKKEEHIVKDKQVFTTVDIVLSKIMYSLNFHTYHSSIYTFQDWQERK